jgi:hypothetical protein
LARVDLVVDEGTELVVADFKTSRCRWSTEHVEEASGQLLLYGELVGRSMPDKPLRLEFMVLTKTKSPSIERHPVPISAARLTRHRQMVRRIWRAIELGSFYPVPSVLHCPGCPFRGPCQDWAG